MRVVCTPAPDNMVLDNQRGRRNATLEQQYYISGKMYDAEMNLRGRPRITDEEMSITKSPDNLDTVGQDKWHHNRTILQRAKAEGVSHFTIQQNQKFAKGIDAIKEVSPELADKILKHKPPDWKL